MRASFTAKLSSYSSSSGDSERYRDKSAWPRRRPEKEQHDRVLPGVDPRRLFVGGVPKVTSDALFRAHFEQFGPVRSIELTAARSFGFVTFEAPESCDSALRERMHSFRHSQHGTAFIEVRRPNPMRGGGGGGPRRF